MTIQTQPQTTCADCGLITLGGVLRGAVIYCLPCAQENFPQAMAEAERARNERESNR